MRKNSLSLVFGLLLSAVWMLGCASSPVIPPAAISTNEVASESSDQPTTLDEVLQHAVKQSVSPVAGDGWRPLFDGATLNGWHISDFHPAARVEVNRGLLLLRMGAPFAGVSYSNAMPNLNYEVTLEAMRVAGDDFFCGLTVPVGEAFVSLIVGGWGGTVVGISSIDGEDASANETTQFMAFETGRWYRVRLRVTERKLEAWIDGKKFVNLVTTEHKLSLRAGDIALSKPFGLASWMTSAAFRDIRIRNVTGPATAD